MFSHRWRSLVGVILVSFPSPLSFAAAPQGSPEDKPPYTNRLIHEKSPYLLQHAHNPVDWYPWGEEAFFEIHFDADKVRVHDLRDLGIRVGLTLHHVAPVAR